MRLALSQVWVGGEQLSAEQRSRIRAAFGCTLRNNYGSSEFYAMAWECAQGCLHLNHDWLILEPVDRQLRPVAPGEASHSVLLTNLANRTQPLLRYKLGDSVRFLSEGCACGSGFPAIEVQGRADHTLVLRDARHREVRLLPLALTTVIEEGAQVTQFQLLCTASDRLELRFEAGSRRPAGDLPTRPCRAVGLPARRRACRRWRSATALRHRCATHAAASWNVCAMASRGAGGSAERRPGRACARGSGQRLAHEIQPVLAEEHLLADEHRRRAERAAGHGLLRCWPPARP